MRKILAGVVALAGIGLMTPRDAHAQVAQGFDVNRFVPSEQNNEWFAADSLDLRGMVRPAFGLVFDGQYRPIVINDASSGKLIYSPVRNMGTMHVGAAVNLFDRVRVGLSLPIVLFEDGHQWSVGKETLRIPAHDQSVGDLRIGLDVRLYGEHLSPFTVAIGAQLFAPSGSQADYTSDGTVRIAPHLAVAGDVDIFTYSARLAFMLNRTENYFGATRTGQEIDFSAAAGVRLLDKRLVVGPEIWGSTVIASSPVAPGNVTGLADDDGKQVNLEGTLGAHFTEGWARFGLGIGPGMVRGYGTPEFRWLASFEIVPPYVLDSDDDGIEDKVDACPNTPGVANAEPKKNGCPADRDDDGIYDKVDACIDLPGVANSDPKKNGCPPDRDNDGVYDKDDACPDLAGIANSDPKKNGCPSDKDGDGIYDKDDACPDVPGVANADPKQNGCPADRDGDGIYDKDDACPDEKGVQSTVAEFNGCPADLDGDGIANEVDACPREAGKPNADPKKNGCPVAFISHGTIQILDQVKFKTGSAEILKGKDSEEILEAVLKVMKDHTEIKKVSVEGHTDNVGNAAFNKRLSASRAASVVKWLTTHGIDKDHLTSTGFGMEKPIADNTKEEGRRENRRVEFHIIADPAAPPANP